MLIFFSYSVLQEYCVLTESRIPLKPGGGELLHFPLVLMNGLNLTESAVFLYCRFSVFLKDPFCPDYVLVTKIISFTVELVSHFFHN